MRTSTLRALWERAFYRQTLLDHLLERRDASSDGGGPDAGVAGSPHVAFELRAPARASVHVDVTVSGPPAARARCEIVVVAGAKPRRSVAEVSARGGSHHLRLPLGAPGGRIVRVELRATGPEVAWRDPVLRWRRPAADVWRSLVLGVRAHGIAGLVRRTQKVTASAERRRIEFAAWRRRHTPDAAALARMAAEAGALAHPPAFAVIVDAAGSDRDALARTLASLERQIYGGWEAYVCGSAAIDVSDARVRHVTAVEAAAARNEAAARTSADFVVVAPAGDEIAPHALAALARAIDRDPAVDVVYSDEAIVDGDAAALPRFKPDWSPEYLLACRYTGRLLAMRRSAILAAGGYRSGFGAAIEYDLLLRVAKPSCAGEARVAHVSEILSEGRAPAPDEGERRALNDFCRSQGIDATVSAGAIPGVWRLRRQLRERPAVTLVIPTDVRVGDTPEGRQPLVAYCVRSLLERTAYDAMQILVVHTAPLTPAVDAALADPRCRRLRDDASGPFNFSRTVNAAVAATSTPVVALLNDDVEPIDAEWLSAMLEYALQERIGAVGAKLFYPDGRLQHVGVATGVCGVAAHLLHQHPGASVACDGIAASVRNCSAVTGACLVTRRAVYDEVGGFDERLATDFNDVDFCLRARRAGYRIVYTPYARLYHHESASFGARRQRPADVEQVRRIWGRTLMHDPYYNANLSRAFADCRLDV